jgi:hypothetical protein
MDLVQAQSEPLIVRPGMPREDVLDVRGSPIAVVKGLQQGIVVTPNAQVLGPTQVPSEVWTYITNAEEGGLTIDVLTFQRQVLVRQISSTTVP